jgi:drug/metabolite transporter, DME family
VSDASSRPGPGRARGVVAIALASVLWGTTGTAASLLPRDVSPLAVGASTMTLGGLLLFAVAGPASVAALRRRAARGWLLVGAIGVVIYALAFYASMHLAGVAVGNVISLGSGPLFAAALEWALERRRPTRRWAVCTAVAVAGIVLLAVGDTGIAVDVPLGVGLGLLAGFAYALYAYASGRAMRNGATNRGAMGAMFGVAALPLAVVLVALGGPLLQSVSSVSIAAYLALGPMLLAYTLFGAGLAVVAASVATTVSLLEPVVATVLAIVVVGERPGPIGWLGLALVAVAIAAIVTARHPDAAPESP